VTRYAGAAGITARVQTKKEISGMVCKFVTSIHKFDKYSTGNLSNVFFNPFLGLQEAAMIH